MTHNSTRGAKRRNALVGAALAVFLMVSAALPAMATVPPKTYTIVVTPTPVTAGTSIAFQVVVANKSNVTMGAINLTVPPLLTISGASASQGTTTVVGNQVQVRSAGLLAGKSMTVTVNAVDPCKAASLTWYVMATTGSNYSGTVFALDTTHSKRTTKVTGACSLAFVSTSEPQDAHPNATITDTAFSAGGPVKVQILDASNNPSAFPANIAVAIGTNPAAGTLAGTLTEPNAPGGASYGDLSIDQPGNGYTLVASSTGLPNATSTPFNIADTEVACVPNVDCIATETDGTTTVTVNAMADPFATGLTVSLVNDGLDCADYTESSATVVFSETSGTRNKAVTISIDSGRESIEGDIPANDYQVCFSSTTGFTDRFGSENVNLGLLPDCDPDVPVAPCISDRVQDGTVVFLTFLAPAGDPRGRI